MLKIMYQQLDLVIGRLSLFYKKLRSIMKNKKYTDNHITIGSILVILFLNFVPWYISVFIFFVYREEIIKQLKTNLK